MRKVAIITGISILLITSPAYAYLDPGSGSVMLQALLAGTAGVAAVVRVYWQKLKSFFCKQESVDKKNKEDDQSSDSNNPSSKS